MTKEEAIEFLKEMQKLLLESIAWSGNEHKINESFTMAIEALSNTSNTLTALDAISRQAAIDELMKRDKALRNINWYDKPFAEGECKGIDDALEIINALPSAQPETRKGKWIGGELGYCSCCGHEGCASDIWTGCKQTYCPNCGAKITGIIEDDEDNNLKQDF